MKEVLRVQMAPDLPHPSTEHATLSLRLLILLPWIVNFFGNETRWRRLAMGLHISPACLKLFLFTAPIHGGHYLFKATHNPLPLQHSSDTLFGYLGNWPIHRCSDLHPQSPASSMNGGLLQGVPNHSCGWIIWATHFNLAIDGKKFVPPPKGYSCGSCKRRVNEESRWSHVCLLRTVYFAVVMVPQGVCKGAGRYNTLDRPLTLATPGQLFVLAASFVNKQASVQRPPVARCGRAAIFPRQNGRPSNSRVRQGDRDGTPKVQRYDGNTARLERRSDEVLGVRVSVAHRKKNVAVRLAEDHVTAGQTDGTDGCESSFTLHCHLLGNLDMLGKDGSREPATSRTYVHDKLHITKANGCEATFCDRLCIGHVETSAGPISPSAQLQHGGCSDAILLEYAAGVREISHWPTLRLNSSSFQNGAEIKGVWLRIFAGANGKKTLTPETVECFQDVMYIRNAISEYTKIAKRNYLGRIYNNPSRPSVIRLSVIRSSVSQPSDLQHNFVRPSSKYLVELRPGLQFAESSAERRLPPPPHITTSPTDWNAELTRGSFLLGRRAHQRVKCHTSAPALHSRRDSAAVTFMWGPRWCSGQTTRLTRRLTGRDTRWGHSGRSHWSAGFLWGFHFTCSIQTVQHALVDYPKIEDLRKRLVARSGRAKRIAVGNEKKQRGLQLEMRRVIEDLRKRLVARSGRTKRIAVGNEKSNGRSGTDLQQELEKGWRSLAGGNLSIPMTHDWECSVHWLTQPSTVVVGEDGGCAGLRAVEPVVFRWRTVCAMNRARVVKETGIPMEEVRTVQPRETEVLGLWLYDEIIRATYPDSLVFREMDGVDKILFPCMEAMDRSHLLDRLPQAVAVEWGRARVQRRYLLPPSTLFSDVVRIAATQYLLSSLLLQCGSHTANMASEHNVTSGPNTRRRPGSATDTEARDYLRLRSSGMPSVDTGGISPSFRTVSESWKSITTQDQQFPTKREAKTNGGKLWGEEDLKGAHSPPPPGSIQHRYWNIVDGERRQWNVNYGGRERSSRRSEMEDRITRVVNDSIGHKEGSFGIGHKEGRFGIGHKEGRFGIGHKEGRFGIGHKEGRFGIGHKEGSFGIGHKEGRFGIGHKEGSFGIGHKERIFGIGHKEGSFGIGHKEGRFGIGHKEGRFGEATKRGVLERPALVPPGTSRHSAHCDVTDYAPINEHCTVVYPSHVQFRQKGCGFTCVQQPMEKRRRLEYRHQSHWRVFRGDDLADTFKCIVSSLNTYCKRLQLTFPYCNVPCASTDVTVARPKPFLLCRFNHISEVLKPRSQLELSRMVAKLHALITTDEEMLNDVQYNIVKRAAAYQQIKAVHDKLHGRAVFSLCRAEASPKRRQQPTKDKATPWLVSRGRLRSVTSHILYVSARTCHPGAGRGKLLKKLGARLRFSSSSSSHSTTPLSANRDPEIFASSMACRLDFTYSHADIDCSLVDCCGSKRLWLGAQFIACLLLAIYLHEVSNHTPTNYKSNINVQVREFRLTSDVDSPLTLLVSQLWRNTMSEWLCKPRQQGATRDRCAECPPSRQLAVIARGCPSRRSSGEVADLTSPMVARLLAVLPVLVDLCSAHAAGMQGWGKGLIPEKAASSGTIPTCENPGAVFNLSTNYVRIQTRHSHSYRELKPYTGPEFSHVGIAQDDSSGWQGFLGDLPFPHPCIPALLHSHLISPSSALKTSLLRATQMSSLTHSSTHALNIDTLITSVTQERRQTNKAADAPATSSKMADNSDSEILNPVFPHTQEKIEQNICLSRTKGGYGAARMRTLSYRRIYGVTPHLPNSPVPCVRRYQADGPHRRFAYGYGVEADTAATRGSVISGNLRLSSEPPLPEASTGQGSFRLMNYSFRREIPILNHTHWQRDVTSLANQHLISHVPAGTPANREPFAACIVQSDARSVPTAPHRPISERARPQQSNRQCHCKNEWCVLYVREFLQSTLFHAMYVAGHWNGVLYVREFLQSTLFHAMYVAGHWNGVLYVREFLQSMLFHAMYVAVDAVPCYVRCRSLEWCLIREGIPPVDAVPCYVRCRSLEWCVLYVREFLQSTVFHAMYVAVDAVPCYVRCRSLEWCVLYVREFLQSMLFHAMYVAGHWSDFPCCNIVDTTTKRMNTLTPRHISYRLFTANTIGACATRGIQLVRAPCGEYNWCVRHAGNTIGACAMRGIQLVRAPRGEYNWCVRHAGNTIGACAMRETQLVRAPRGEYNWCVRHAGNTIGACATRGIQLVRAPRGEYNWCVRHAGNTIGACAMRETQLVRAPRGEYNWCVRHAGNTIGACATRGIQLVRAPRGEYNWCVRHAGNTIGACAMRETQLYKLEEVWPEEEEGVVCSQCLKCSFSHVTIKLAFNVLGHAVVWWLDHSPPTKANRVRFPVESPPGFSHVGIVPDDVADRQVFSGISRFPGPCILALLHTHLASPSSSRTLAKVAEP
ncbi:hypothetical protein PR048_020635 [Dryococelus australis]|uniref:Uncharacterized protein n=1 Tax=Dryococelus australis TaxID=614101 RepID=A0ABQ9H7A0_9NEOP|nr:hypothetical protein PR048_020635 [Dryococelus australis]